MNTGAIVGIAVAATAVIIIAGVGLFCFFRRRRARRARASGDGITGPSEGTTGVEIDSKVPGDKTEETNRHPPELTGSTYWEGSHPSELTCSSQHKSISELDAKPQRVELQGAGQIRYELP